MYIWCDIWWFWHVKGQFVWTLKLIYLCSSGTARWFLEFNMREVHCSLRFSSVDWSLACEHLLIFFFFWQQFIVSLLCFLLFIMSFWPSFYEVFFVVWHCTTLQCAKAEDIPDIKFGSIGKDRSCFVFQIVSVFLCFCFQIVFHSDPECHIRQCFFDVLYMYTTNVKDVWLRILWYCLLYFISTFWLLFVAFCFMMSWTTRRIRTFTLDEAQLRSAKRTFGNRISQLFGAFGWSSQEHWACEFCKMRTFCLWVLHPGSLTYAKNALQTIASGVIIWTKRSRTRYLDLFCLFINSSIFTPRIMALHPSPCWTCQLEGLKSWQVLTSEVMRIPGERRGVLCQDVVEMLEPPCRWEAVGPIGQLFASFSAVGNLLRYFMGHLLRIVGWFHNGCMLML